VAVGAVDRCADSGDPPVANRHVAFDDIERVVHGDDQTVANQKGTGRRDGGSHFIDSSEASRLAILPCFTAISSARMLAAISCGVTAPMSRPIGAWTRASCSDGSWSAAS